MEDMESYIISAAFFLILCILWGVWKFRKNKKSKDTSGNFILDTLELARSQYEILNLKPIGEKENRLGISAMIKGLDSRKIILEVSDYISQDLISREVDAYFHVRKEEGPIFFVFRSAIKNIESDYSASHIILAFPQHLRVEKKRHFIRVKPDQEEVRIVGVWPLRPGKKLPVSTDDIGSPVTHYKPGMKDEPVQLENVSGSGLALRLRLDANGKPPFEWKNGGQLLCLVVYDEEASSEKPVAFWCTAEIMNSRIVEGAKPSLILGLEFTNWAVLEQGKGEIHWTHSSPSRGAKPILRWVENMEKKKVENTIQS